MMQVVGIDHKHKDLIHDIQYDYHGRRIATCSSDQSVKVWDMNEHGEWVCSASWKTHHGCVWKVSWANPEFGQVLATCSFDRTAIVWEEVIADTSEAPRGLPLSAARSTNKHWVKRCTLVESRSNVTDVKFGPPHLGLVLATCSANGVVRIYECQDIMALGSWNIQHEMAAGHPRSSCVAWNQSKYHPPLIAVGCDVPATLTEPGSDIVARLVFFERLHNQNKWARVDAGTLSREQLTMPVYDLQFAPNIGRSVHYLAVASKNAHIFKLTPKIEDNEVKSSEDTTPTTPTVYDISETAVLDAHEGQVWRISWNVTGTVLCTSGADATVRLWRANYMGRWTCMSIVQPHNMQAALSPLSPKVERETSQQRHDVFY